MSHDNELSLADDVAVIGMSGRFPGAADVAELWQNLCDGKESVSFFSDEEVVAAGVPAEVLRNPRLVKAGGVLTEELVAGFDAGFFGYSPREARLLDPQQRLFMECAREALEVAGHAPETLGREITGVYAGSNMSDYMVENLKSQLGGVPSASTLELLIAVDKDYLATRVSYKLNLKGPALTIQTACSTSLVAVHVACEHLLSRQCDFALAGGVALRVPQKTGYLHEPGMIFSSDGHCRAFDARAEGTVQGSGVGVVALRRLEDAVADGDEVLAVIKGSAINNDGSLKVGYTAPSVEGQAEVISEALALAGVDPETVTYVEAHGTGTTLGDPVEIVALTRAFRTRKKQFCAIGSLKTNLGHLGSAAGVAGLIKTVLALKHRTLPPSLHFEEPNPRIDFERSPFYVNAALAEWRRNGTPLRAGVSSFGVGGTNAHVVLEEAPAARASEAPARPLHLLTLSARSEPALREAARRHDRRLGADGTAPAADVCFTANAGRAHFGHRLAVLGATTAELREKVAAFAAGGEAEGLHTGRVEEEEQEPRLVFLFTGQGSQYPGMGRQLYETQPTFRQALERCDEILRPHLDRPLLSVLYPEDGDGSRLHQTGYAQPALFALEHALAETWKSWGIEPAAVLGHSVGEYVAAEQAGVFSLEDALKLIAERGRRMQELPAGGEMASVTAPVARVRQAIAPYPGELAVAAVNGPRSTVVSGAAGPLAAVLEELEAEGIRVRRLEVSHAFHSPLVEPMLPAFEEVARTVRHQPPKLELISNVSGAPWAPGEAPDAAYWRRHVREPVHFAAGMESLRRNGYRIFVEVGPQATLLGMGRRCLEAEEGALWLPSLRSGREDWRQMLSSLGQLYLRGVPVDWKSFDRDARRCRVALPAYPYERQRYWVEPEKPGADAGAWWGQPGAHPLLGRRLPSPLREIQLASRVDTATLPFLADHQVYDVPVLPASAYAEMALAAARELGDGERCTLDDLSIHEALPLGGEAPKDLYLVLVPESGGGGRCEIFARGVEEEAWRLHARGRIRAEPAATPPPPDLDELRRRCCREQDAVAYYRRLVDLGMGYGPTFQGLRRLWRGEGEALALVEAPADVGTEAPYRFHPALLDACWQALGVAVADPEDMGTDGVYMPLGIDQITLHARPGKKLWSHVSLRAAAGGDPARGVPAAGEPAGAPPMTLTADVCIFDDDGRVLAETTGMRLKRTSREALKDAAAAGQEWLYQVRWRPQERTAPPADAAFLASPAAVMERVRPEVEPLCRRHRLEVFGDLVPELDRLSSVYAWRVLGELRVAERFTSDAVAERLGVVRAHRRLLGRLLEMLTEDGFLRREGEEWEVTSVPEPSDPEARSTALAGLYPDSRAQIELVHRCGSKLPAVLTGEQDPLELLFPSDGGDLAEQLYRQSPGARAVNGVAARALTELIGELPPERTLRMLEIGGGTGGTTCQLLPRLPADRCEYVFTDVSSHFLVRARQQWGEEYPFLRGKVLDISRSPAEQGFPRHGYDVIVAANVLHATPDLRQTLRRVRELLAPGGVLLLVEGTGRHRWTDVTFGMTEGWWNFVDQDLRPSYPLLERDRWPEVLGEVGFAEAELVTVESAAAPESLRQAVILAREPQAMAGEAEGKWLILADQQGAGDRLAQELRSRNQSCFLVSPGTERARRTAERLTVDPTSAEDFTWLVEQMAGTNGKEWRGVVHLWSLDATAGEALEVAELERLQQRFCGSALSLVQALNRLPGRATPGLWLVTRAAEAVTGAAGETVDPLPAPLRGLGKVIAVEHPELSCVRPDLDGIDESRIRALAEELLAPDGEDQVAWRDGVRHVPRLERPGAETAAAGAAPPDGPYKLVNTTPGSLDGLELRASERRPPGPGEVEIEVVTAGLNFKDVLNALGMVDISFGGECAGRISALGAGVRGFRRGDEVLAVAGGALGRWVVTPAEFVRRKPESLSFEQAATIPGAFLTAWYALHELAGLRAGERVLIHAATGGVGMAAVQIAERAGAEIFATAGSDEKRALLKERGIAHVMNSRTTDFADQVMAATGGRGVDVVLNSLAGEMTTKSLEVLAPDGRFVELGKTGEWDAEQVARLRPDVRWHLFDLATVSREQPKAVESLFGEVMAALLQGEVVPLPSRVFPVAEAVTGFRYMAQAKHVGKVVFAMTPDAAAPAEVREDGTYLITGGLGGLGRRTARWLFEQGARHLVLAGRGTPTEEALEDVRRLEEDGAEVLVRQADVSDERAVARLLAGISKILPPLRGVFHLAGVLDDGVLLRQDWERFAGVMGPKVSGAWNLHRLTLGEPLDFFVLFSSTASLLGSPGQGNHSAANAFLDALAHHRRALGQPALSVNWGAWSEVGAAASRERQERLELQGVGAIPPARGMELLGRLLRQGEPQVAAMAVDWTRLLKQLFADGRAPAWLGEIAADRGDRQASSGAASPERSAVALPERITSAPLGRRRALLGDFVRDQVARVLELGPSQLPDPRQPLDQLGLDSLIAVELRNVLGRAVGETLPATLLFDYPTVEALTGYLAGEVFRWEEEAAAGDDGSGAEEEAWAPDPQVSADQMEKLLAEELDGIDGILERG